MVLVDTSIWLDYLRKGNPHLVRLLDANLVSVHPWVVGELGCGNLEVRASVLGLLRALPQLPVATEDEMAHFLERHPLAGKGIGYLDMHLQIGREHVCTPVTP